MNLQDCNLHPFRLPAHSGFLVLKFTQKVFLVYLKTFLMPLFDEGISKICKTINYQNGFLRAHAVLHCRQLKKSSWYFNFLNIFAIFWSIRHEKRLSKIGNTFVVFKHSRNIPCLGYCALFSLFAICTLYIHIINLVEAYQRCWLSRK